MGMYDELNKISSGILSKSQVKQQIKEQQEFEKELETELLQIMQERLIFEAENNNIFTNETKERIILQTIEEYLTGVHSTAWRNKFNNKYRKNLENFLNQNYFSVAGKAERIEKKQNATKDNYKKQIAVEKWQLQKQIMQQKINGKAQKDAQKLQLEAELKRQARQELISTALSITGKTFIILCKIALYMILAPFFILACFFGGFAGGMIKLK